MVRPLLEYCVQVWSPYKQKHIDLIEGVQKRVVRMVLGMIFLSYELITNKEGINSDICSLT